MPKTLLAALRRNLVQPWRSQPLGKRRGACGLQRIAHLPADVPVTQVSDRLASPPPPRFLLKTSLDTSPTTSSPLFLHDPTRLAGSADLLAFGLMRRPLLSHVVFNVSVASRIEGFVFVFNNYVQTFICGRL